MTQVSRSTVEDNASGVRAAHRPRPGVVLVYAGGPTCRAWPLDGKPLVVGRTAPARIVIDDERASREHVELAFVGGSFTIRDLRSRNGTFVAGRPVAPGLEHVADGDRVMVRVGGSLLLLLADATAFLDDDHPVEIRDAIVAGPPLRDLLARVARTAAAGDPLLVTGESGTGKELIARRYHAASPRADGPFIAVNSAAIPEAIAERLLFGAVKGAYSGAATDAAGYLQEAHGGTLFLDELGELPSAVQAKLLRVLETGEVTPVGGTRARPVSFGLVAATNRDVRAEVAVGRFRADLYYRVGRARLSLPPLRDRPEEIPWLVTDEIAAVDRRLTAHARLIEACCLASWPGNVRELRSEVRFAALEASAQGLTVVAPEHLSDTAGAGYSSPSDSNVQESRNEISREQVEEALAFAKGNVSAAARRLQVHRNQLYRMMDRLGLKRGDE